VLPNPQKVRPDLDEPNRTERKKLAWFSVPPLMDITTHFTFYFFPKQTQKTHTPRKKPENLTANLPL
jgi:hypothetical protein